MARQSLKSIAKETVFIAVAAFFAAAAYHYVVDAIKSSRHPAIPDSTSAGQSIAEGMVVSVKGETFEAIPLTIVLVVSDSCRYCVESIPFYRGLLPEIRSSGARTLLALPPGTPKESPFRALSTGADGIRAWSDLSFRIQATPTLIAVGPSGVVKAVWVGRLSGRQQTSVMETLRAAAPPNASKTAGAAAALAASDLEALLRQKKAVLLDVREREPFNHGHTAGARNIPLAELPPRARFELDAGLIAVVDCTVVSPAACDAAVGLLSTHHPEVAVRTLGRNNGASACAGSPGLAGETGGTENARAQ